MVAHLSRQSREPADYALAGGAMEALRERLRHPGVSRYRV